jgi:hypothetical protein
VFLRLALTVLAALVVLALRLPATDRLDISPRSCRLSGIPFALVPLVWLTGRVAAVACALLIVALNVYLLAGAITP